MRDLLRLLKLLAPHKGRIALGLGLALVTLLANIGLLALSSWFIASMALAGSLGLAMAIDLPAAGVRALAILRALGRYAERLVNHDTTFRILSSLRLWFYRRMVPLAPAGLAAFRGGDLLARIRADIDRLDDYYVRGLVPAAVALLGSACILPFLARFDPRLALIDGLALAAAGILVPSLLALRAARPGRERVLASAELRASVVEEIGGMGELVALGAAAGHARLMDEISARLDESQRRLASIGGMGEASIGAAGYLAVWASSLVLVGLVAAGALAPAQLASLSVFVLASFESILPLPAAIQKAGEMGEAARRLFEILDAEPAVPAPAAALPTRTAAAPSRTAAAPSRAAAAPSRTAAPPTRTAAVPSRTAALPTRAAAVPSRAAALPPRAAAAPSRTAALPSRTAALPSQTAALPSQTAALPSQTAAPPSRTAAAPSRTAAFTSVGLSIRGLRFRYAPGLPTVFDALDLELPAGTRLGLAGPSGSGKSSLVSLLLRFWDYEGGSIELLPAASPSPGPGSSPGPGHSPGAGASPEAARAAIDLRSLESEEARRFFSVLPQSPFLWHASIRDNLLLAARPEGGDPGPGDEERLLEALEVAQLSSLIARLPQGLDTMVGEAGKAVSAGELQRIAIARALLKDAPICLLDEPTEGLDDRTAESLLESLARRLEGRSLMIISHRERDFHIAGRVERLGEMR